MSHCWHILFLFSLSLSFKINVLNYKIPTFQLCLYLGQSSHAFYLTWWENPKCLDAFKLNWLPIELDCVLWSDPFLLPWGQSIVFSSKWTEMLCFIGWHKPQVIKEMMPHHPSFLMVSLPARCRTWIQHFVIFWHYSIKICSINNSDIRIIQSVPYLYVFNGKTCF